MQAKVREFLSPVTDNITWSPELIESALRKTLNAYTMYAPMDEATFTASSAGAEQDLAAGSGAISNIYEVCAVAYPWPDDDTGEWWDLGQFFRTTDQSRRKIIMGRRKMENVPSGGKIRVRYRGVQTIQGLDGASATTFPDQFDNYIATGGAGYACELRNLDLGEDPSTAANAGTTLQVMMQSFLGEFNMFLQGAAAKSLNDPAWMQVGMERPMALALRGLRGR